jgi:hypothetical protein
MNKSGCSNEEKNLYSYQQSNPGHLACILVTVAGLIVHVCNIFLFSTFLRNVWYFFFTRMHGVTFRKTGVFANSCNMESVGPDKTAARRSVFAFSRKICS